MLFYPPRSDALFSNYFEDLLSKMKDFSRSQAVTYIYDVHWKIDNISETVLDRDVVTTGH